MNKSTEQIFSIRPTVIFELPLKKHVRILHPEQVILKIGPNYCDIGAFCYLVRARHRKENGKARSVVITSLLKQRPRQILRLIKALSSLVCDSGRRISTVKSYDSYFKLFLDWTDSNGYHDCLSGGEATRRAYIAWVEKADEGYRRGDFGEVSYNDRVRVNELLQLVSGLEIPHNIRKLKRRSKSNGVTEPLSPHDFAHAVALNQALFNGICDLVLDYKSFPFKLVLPNTLGWAENHLWVFPTHIWRLPPHRWGLEREKFTNKTSWAYNYAEGCLATPEEIAHRFKNKWPSARLACAQFSIENAEIRINCANGDERDWVRRMLSMIAHNAFLFLFVCNTGANESVAREIETDGEVDPTTLNQKYRSIKFRAGGKVVTLVVPVTFMPTLRRFMTLRKYLLDDIEFPFLFFTLGHREKNQAPSQVGSGALVSLYTNVLSCIDPDLPRMATRKLRATVADWFQRNHDASVTAKVLQNSENTVKIHYDAGSATDHHEEMSIFLSSVSASAKRQRVIADTAAVSTRGLEDGGGCENFGHPEALETDVPVKPDCLNSQGCLFCVHRILVACEDDARKVASAAFVMEQLILGQQHEDALRPLIVKCRQDLERIAAFDNCRSMVENVKIDVFENGNLTPFFNDKYQLFLEIGVIV